MLSIERLNEFGEAAIAACPELGEHVVVSSEAELKDILNKVKLYPLLVCVIPKSTGDDVSHDNFAERNSGLFYVISPFSERMNKQDRVALWTSTQTAMKVFKGYIRSQMEDDGEFHAEFWDADFAGRDQEPEYNFQGCIGWSLLFDYTTAGL